MGGGAGGLELATALGDCLGKRGRAEITLVDKERSHVWKPKLHKVAAGSMDVGLHEVSYRAQAHWHGFRFRVGELTGLDRERREVHVAPFVDEGGVQVTPARSFGYDTLVMAVGSRSNDFGTPGVAEHALMLETTADASAFQRRLVNACIRAHARGEPLAPHPPPPGGQATARPPIPGFRLTGVAGRVQHGGQHVGGASGGGLVIEGFAARLMYLSLHKMHELALHGATKVVLDTLARMLTRRTESHVKLH